MDDRHCGIIHRILQTDLEFRNQLRGNSPGSALFGFPEVRRLPASPALIPPKGDSSRVLSIGMKGGVAERRQSNEDELFQLTICVALALVAAASLLGPHLDGMRTVGLIAALIHLKPFGLLADHMDWLRDAPYFGEALFAPSSFARGVPMEFEAVAALSSESREAVMAGSGAAAAVLWTLAAMPQKSRRVRLASVEAVLRKTASGRPAPKVS